ncbi:substrate-binding domain-containing protein [Vagococcus salmoninarum]|uniref:Sugar ABC transporter substrate-binding protein n=1 Tax=Vagococcus salmoninarum TaxID=2739 RepID=A0A429ZHG7_9ENTE|nr:substrate-binding domain-containing protein [Vagococcus salmoninarum]MBE9389089.1 substrate-binding domain-containing protein [Vagococcus salmoninarum]RST93161.1 sugar ABC transporter substrate-binding protein [Vagococcus salmoninarum]
MKYALKLMVVVLAGLIFAGCQQTVNSSDDEAVEIGYAINNLNDTFQTYILEAARAEVESNDYTLRVENAKEDLITQQDQVNTLIQNGVKGLIVVPVDTSAMAPITEAAQTANIPLVYVNRNPFAGQEEEMPEGVYYVGSEEITAGIMQMEFVGEQLAGEGKIAVLMGILGNEGAVKRTEGVEETLAKDFPEMEVLNKESAEWQRDQALGIAENWLSTYGDELKGIIANNDEMALGAVQAAKNSNRSDLIIMGIDAIPDAIEAIEAGELAGTIFQDAVGQGGGSAEILGRLLNDENTDEPVTYVPFKLVTSDNVAEFK